MFQSFQERERRLHVDPHSDREFIKISSIKYKLGKWRGSVIKENQIKEVVVGKTNPIEVWTAWVLQIQVCLAVGSF